MAKALVHLLRSIGRSRGFGVQSPTDYDYLRYVLCESWPYYAYRPLRRSHRAASCRLHRLGRLLLRVANDLQPRHVFLCTHADDALLSDYIHGGCRSAQITHSPDDAPLWVVDACEWPACLPDGCGPDEALPPSVRVLVLTGIHGDAPSEQLWNHVLEDSRAVASYDFFHFGVVVTGHRQTPHHYLVSQFWDF